MLPTLWEAIAFEGTQDRVLRLSVILLGCGQLLAVVISVAASQCRSFSFVCKGLALGAVLLLAILLFYSAHVDDPLRILYAGLFSLISLRVPPYYRGGFLREPLLSILFGLSLLFSLGVVRHEWWYCELKGEVCTAIASTHLVAISALLLISLVLFRNKGAPLLVKGVGVLGGSLLLGSTAILLLSDLSRASSFNFSRIDSSVGLLCAIVVTAAPYVSAVFTGVPYQRRDRSSLVTVSAVIVSIAFLLIVLVPTVIQFYRAPNFNESSSDGSVTGFTVNDELVSLLLTAEDPTFFFHSGVDFVRLRDAVSETLSEGRFGRGGSTLSMQLSKVLFLDYDKTIIRKMRQLVLGLLIELSYPKEIILREYLRSVTFAPGVVGIESAAQKFFSLPVQHLDREQLVRLVLAIYNPTVDLSRGRPFAGEVSVRARTIESREKVFRSTLVEQWRAREARQNPHNGFEVTLNS